MGTAQQQTIRRNYACSIDETAYMQARLAGKFLIVYKDEVSSPSPSLSLSLSPSPSPSLSRSLSRSGQGEEVCSPSRSGQDELQVYSLSGQFPVGSRSHGIQLETETITTNYFLFTKPKFHNSICIGNPVDPLITEIVRCRGSPELWPHPNPLQRRGSSYTQMFRLLLIF